MLSMKKNLNLMYIKIVFWLLIKFAKKRLLRRPLLFYRSLLKNAFCCSLLFIFSCVYSLFKKKSVFLQLNCEDRLHSLWNLQTSLRFVPWHYHCNLYAKIGCIRCETCKQVCVSLICTIIANCMSYWAKRSILSRVWLDFSLRSKWQFYRVEKQ